MTSLALQDRIEAMLGRYEGRGSPPSRRDLADLHADGRAAIIALEYERLRLKRRMRAADYDREDDPDAAEEAAALAVQGEQLAAELAQLKRLVGRLRAAMHAAEAGDDPDGPPRRRFRRD